MAKQTKQVAIVAAPKSTATVSDSAASISRQAIDKAVIAAQIAQPHAQFIYVNAEGHYHLHSRVGFVKVSMVNGEMSAQRTPKPIRLAPVPSAPVAVEDDTEEEINEEVPVPNDGLEF